MKRVIKYTVVLLMIMSLNSCNNKACKGVDGIEISETLRVSLGKSITSYCNLLEKSLSNDSSSIKAFSMMTINDSAGYDHGAIIIKIINQIGEETYIAALGELSGKEKYNLQLLLQAGIEYGKFENPHSSLSIDFPILYKTLK